MNNKPWFQTFWHTIIGEPRCVLCHEIANGTLICVNCIREFDYLRNNITHQCPYCLQSSLDANPCGSCQKLPPIIKKLFASYRYESVIKQLLHAFKHKRHPYFAKPIAQLMLSFEPSWINKINFDCVIAMPLSKERLFERGFNQTELIVKELNKHKKWPILDKNAILRQHRPAQSTLSKTQRMKNVRGIFQINVDVKNFKVLLIDDVVTTGATIKELSESLIRSGVSEVWAWTLAHPN